MTGIRKYINSWFLYNQWRYEIIYNHLLKNKNLINTEKDELLYFSNIKSTLNHTLAADVLWYMRIFGKNEVNLLNENFEFKKINSLWGRNFSELIYRNKESFYLNRLNDLQREMIILFLKEIDNNEKNDLFFTEDFYYYDTLGNKIVKNRFDCFYHIINHSTHHIGQVSSIISKYDKKFYPELDFTYFLSKKI